MGAGAQRAAERMFYGVGGQSVMLRMPVAAVAGVLSEELGLPTTGTSDAELGPVLVRAMAGGTTEGARWELLAPAKVIAGVAGDATVATALGMFAEAVGVVVDGELLRIARVSYQTVEMAVYLYRVEMVGAVGGTV